MDANAHGSIKKAVRTAMACGVATGFVFGGAALAAEQNQATSTPTATTSGTKALKAVEVTGTRIKRTSVEQAQPIQIITQAQIKASGFTTIGQVLQNMPSVGSSLNTQNDNFATPVSAAAGQTTLNLRNLGSQRTLVLVNGHRWTTGLDGSVDLNSIPTSIIDHVEILQDGASAIYGSDAIAGVVNIITIKNFDGAEASAYLGIHHGDGHWDGQVRNYSATVGFGTARGNLLLNASYENEQGVSSANRALSAFPIYGTGTTRGNSSIPQGRFQFIPPYGGSTSDPNNSPAASTGLTSAQCPTSNFGSATAPDYLPFCNIMTIPGTRGTSPSDFQPFTSNDNFNYAPWGNLITPDQRFNLYSAGHYDLTDNLTLNFEAATEQRHASQPTPPPSLAFGFASSAAAMDLPPGQGFNPFNFELNSTAPIGPGFLDLIQRRAVELGPQVNTEDENLVHLRAGASGFFDLGSSEWDWDAGYMFSKDTAVDSVTGMFDLNRLAVQASSPAACAAQAALGCTPINLFGGQTSPITAAQFAYAQYLDRFVYHRNAHALYADITNSDIVDLPAGPMGFAAGYEFDNKSGTYQPSAVAMQQATPPAPTSGNVDTSAEYVEIDIPLLANIPLAKLVDLDVASRHTDVQASVATSHNTSSRAGLKWQPTDDLLLRGTWSQGFRAPSISELFAGRTVGLTIAATDPCSSYQSSGVPASVQQLCAAQGVPPSYAQASPQIPMTTAGNVNLRPETSVSKTVGFVYSPDWFPGFNANMDYYRIKLENTIQSIGAGNVLYGCYYQAVAGDCARVLRFTNGTGNLKTINDSKTNIGGTLTEGVDVGAGYTFPTTEVGQFGLSVQGTYTRKYDQFFPDGSGGITTTSLAGVERGGSIFPLGIPRWKAVANATWSLASWHASWQVQYIGPMHEHCSDFMDNTPFSLTNLGLCSQPDVQNNALSQNRLAATVYHNAQVSYTYDAWNTTFAFGIDNLFNKNPPVDVLSTVNSYDTSLYPIPGRFFYGSVSVKF